MTQSLHKDILPTSADPSQPANQQKVVIEIKESAFQYIKVPKGQYLEAPINHKNYMFCMLEGAAKICIDGAHKYLTEDELVIIAHGQDFVFECDRDCALVIYAFDALYPEHDQYLNGINRESVDCIEDNIILSENANLRSYLENLVRMLEIQTSWNLDYEYRTADESFNVLKQTYSRSELISLFSPIIRRDNEFRNFIFYNCDKVSSVEQFVEISGLSRTTFYTRFKQEFGMSIHRWLQLRTAQRVERDASIPLMTVEELMKRNGFTSPANFIRFCRNQFGCTPSKFIKKARQARA